MAAKPRITVRLSASTLHQLWWLSERRTSPPAEIARYLITAFCQAELLRDGLQAQWQSAYNDWLREISGGTAEVPDQTALDALTAPGWGTAAANHAAPQASPPAVGTRGWTRR